MSEPIRGRLPWIDRRLQQLPPRPFRKVHLDFHNSEHVPSIGEGFDPDEWGDRLLAGHLDSIVVFAKDMHGLFYYPSAYGPVHPRLGGLDLLGGQVEACRARGIKVYAYYCVTWDNYLAEQHPEWLVWKRDRTTYLPRFDETPGWTALCLTNEDFVRLVLDHSREILERYELDGIWFDMPLPIGGECYCRNCLAILQDRGKDPFDTQAQYVHKQELLTAFMRRAHAQAHEIRPGCQVDQNNQTRLGLGERAPFMDNIDIEALPTASWGYLYYPTMVRYARNFGTSVCGMTGRFQRSWADFGGLKHPDQLRAELAGIVAHGAQADIGDQMPPSGRLDPAVYETIGRGYRWVEEMEPYLRDAAPVTEAALLVDGPPLLDFGAPSMEGPGGELSRGVLGCAKLLSEHHAQFDILEASDVWERYRLVVLPDPLRVDEVLAERLCAFLDGGGALLASHASLRLDGTEELWAGELLGLSYAGESPFAPSYMKLEAALRGDLPDYEYALYEGAARWAPAAGREGTMLARLGEPLFQRSPEHYTSHAQSPLDHLTQYAAVARAGRLGAMAFPVGASYYRNGYWIYREVFGRLLREVLPERLLETDAPMSAEVALTHQQPTAEHPERWMAHIVGSFPARRSPEHVEYVEAPVPLRDVAIELTPDAEISRAYVAGSGDEIPLHREGDRWRAEIPRIDISAIVVFETSARGG